MANQSTTPGRGFAVMHENKRKNATKQGGEQNKEAGPRTFVNDTQKARASKNNGSK